VKGRRRLLLTMIIGAGCLLALLAGSALAVPQTAAAATKPAITIQPTDQTVEPGSLATFISTARGDPRPTVQWQQSHDGGRSWQAVPGATRYTLQVKATSGKDGFLYRAVFKNSAGTVKSRGALLDVRENVKRPRVTRQPPSITVFAGKRAIFTAKATGIPTPTVQWQRSIAGGPWVYLTSQTRTTLKFSATKVQNGHRYRAVFTNVNGVAVTNVATLTVLDPTSKPVIRKQPTNEKVPAGKRATFVAQATGNPTPKVKWEQSENGTKWTAIPGARSDTLRFEATMRKDGWRFRAVYENSAGKTYTRAALLDVTPPAKKPKITSQPSDERVNAGQTATFTAAAHGRPTPWVEWQFSTNGGRNWRDVSGAKSRTLKVKATNAKNGNLYRAVFTNKAGSTRTRAAKLNVIGDVKPVILTQPVQQTVVNGRTATFTASADGRPTPTVQWQQSPNGSNWSNVSGATSLTYSFTATTAKDGYLYRAVFKNRAGTTRSRGAKLTVISQNTPPTINQQPRDAAKVSGGTVQFTSTASGVPDPTVQWQRSLNGGAWAAVAGATSTTYSFTATPDLNGSRYRAVFTNSAGTATSSIVTLTVWTVPTLATQPTDQSGTIGTTVTFTSTATGNPDPSVRWQYSSDGGTTWQYIAGATSTTLLVGVKGDEDGWLFRAVFTNVAGTSTSNQAQLTVLAGS